MTHDVEESTAEEVSTQDVHTEDDVSTGESKKTRGSIRPPAELYDEFIALKRDDESANDLLKRLIDASTDVDTLQGSIDDLVSSNEHLQKRVDDLSIDLESDRRHTEKLTNEHIHEVKEFQALIKTLENAAETAVATVGGQASLDSFGIKDVIEEARDMCGGDDTECLKIAGKMMDVKLHFASKAVDHEHNAEQNRLDRELKEDLAGKERGEKAKDREFREKLTTQEQQNKIELQLLKKGIVKKSVLEDAAFINISSVPKQPKKVIAEEKKQAFHEAEDEDTYDFDPEEMTDDHPE